MVTGLTRFTGLRTKTSQQNQELYPLYDLAATWLVIKTHKVLSCRSSYPLSSGCRRRHCCSCGFLRHFSSLWTGVGFVDVRMRRRGTRRRSAQLGGLELPESGVLSLGACVGPGRVCSAAVARVDGRFWNKNKYSQVLPTTSRIQVVLGQK